MILPGTKIEVIASNKRNKGPNVGSIGFVASTSRMNGAHAFRFNVAATSLISHCEFAKHNADSGLFDTCISMKKGSTTKKLSLVRAVVVFNRFGAKGRFRLEAKPIFIVVPMAPLKSKRTVKGFLKGFTTLKVAARYTAVTTLPQRPTLLKEMNGKELLTRLYAYTLAAARSPEFKGRYAMTGELLVKRDYNRTIIDDMDLSRLPLTKSCQTLLRRAAIGNYDEEVYRKVIADNNVVQAVRDMRNVAIYFFNDNLKRIALNLKKRFPVTEQTYLMQYLEPQLREHIYNVMNLHPSIRNEIMDNTNTMNALFRSLSTVHCRTRHTK